MVLWKPLPGVADAGAPADDRDREPTRAPIVGTSWLRVPRSARAPPSFALAAGVAHDAAHRRRRAGGSNAPTGCSSPATTSTALALRPAAGGCCRRTTPRRRAPSRSSSSRTTTGRRASARARTAVGQTIRVNGQALDDRRRHAAALPGHDARPGLRPLGAGDAGRHLDRRLARAGRSQRARLHGHGPPARRRHAAQAQARARRRDARAGPHLSRDRRRRSAPSCMPSAIRRAARSACSTARWPCCRR